MIGWGLGNGIRLDKDGDNGGFGGVKAMRAG